MQKLFKLIIVDDEQAICDGIVSFVDWSSIGFEVMGCFLDGRDAIEYIDNNQVDAVLTDIKMTYVSGLELAQYVWENHPDIKVVILTGYSDFSYAKNACRYGVFNYLLKPTQISEVKEVFTKLYERLSAPDSEVMTLKNLYFLQTKFFQSLFSAQSEQAISEFSQLMKFLGNTDIEVRKSFLEHTFELMDKKLYNISISGTLPDFTIHELSENPSIANEYILKISKKISKSGILNENIAIQKAKKYIEEHYSENITLKDLAGHVYLSPTYFSKIFKKYCHENFSVYLLHLRIKKAQQLLISTEIKVYEIASLVGIHKEKYFYKIFKDTVGLTPNEYRALHTKGKS